MKSAILVLVLAVLAGCGSGSPDAPAGAVPAAIVSVAPNQVVELRVVELEPADPDGYPYGLRSYDLALASGQTYHIEWTGGTIKVGDLVTEEAEEGRTVIYSAGDLVDVRYKGGL